MRLESLLRRLASGRSYTFAELATEMDITTDLLEQMLGDLERAGCVRVVEESCVGRCDHCPYQGLCDLAHGGRIWAVTDKGLTSAQIV